MFMEKLTDHGEPVVFEGVVDEGGQPFYAHPFQAEKGGILLKDEDNVVPEAIKDIAAKVAKSIAKGQLADVTKTPSPSILHHFFSHHAMLKNDLTYCRKYLKPAAAEANSVERMKYVVAFYMSSHFINPTLIQGRVPLNPIMGETY